MEHRTGASFDALVRERVCARLGMADTTAQVPALDAGRFAVGHDARGRRAPHWDVAVLAGAGALRSTASDLLAFLEAHLRAAGSSGTGSEGVPAGAPPVLLDALRDTHVRRVGRGPQGQALGWQVMSPMSLVRRFAAPV